MNSEWQDWPASTGPIPESVSTLSRVTSMKENLKNRTCELCGATISLEKTGKVGFKWATNPEKPKDSWRCLPTKDYPVRAHSPAPFKESARGRGVERAV